MAQFHSLTVTDVNHDTRDAVVVTLAPGEADREAFDFTQGQYLTFRHDFDGTEVRRCYSICAGKDDGVLRVGIKRVDGGAFSSWAKENIKPGDVMEAMPPMGNFFVPLDPDAERHYLGFAGGSGITPVLSLIKTVLAREPNARFTLVYANRAVNTIMFREELEDLKNIYLGRFTVLHILENDAQEIDLFTGRVDADKLDALFTHWIDAASVDYAFICGPEPMMLAIAEGLKARGLPEDRIKFELFKSAQPGRLPKKANGHAAGKTGDSVKATLFLEGVTRTIEVPKDGTTLLDAALDAGLNVPYACKAGVCSTCMCKITEGAGEMLSNNALEDHEVRDGFTLSCQTVPTTDTISVTYDV
jgi:ring-1,2-phenylacetyl-CoA epoxidase subunit PaaE